MTSHSIPSDTIAFKSISTGGNSAGKTRECQCEKVKAAAAQPRAGEGALQRLYGIAARKKDRYMLHP